ncbi:chromosome segregation protein SMC [Listeria fleischmannii subsp. coloradonensis]|uniref:chromosome segregation protein SMC n=1 Tax=Listeria fleischmannii TaxID=1069827 RepID=UPI000254F3F2|nr:chromosome segregation protein SMC [Listeria fleischmannii]EIA19594.1 chromosome segregation protein SMC [Listeria fleischmannii subsp. coloradonensis]
MLLKRLEMNGFKSFADKVAIDFVPGMTAVVGPNGSGKSNITEAIRWVLGEQSAKSLRGGRMGDVIFAGSDTRKPINFAEVSLVLDNDDHFLPLDYSEVYVTRRIYRNGDSEFLINKQSCRLKDIVDLFMDSGLGRESMSIISQGKIDEILNSKPEERRSIFEEAAGVLKYKNRKKQAENKLFETEENLNRVQDILYELDGQLEPLEMQASIAKDYLYQVEELEKVEVTLLSAEIETITETLETWRTAFQENETALLSLRKEISELETSAFSKKEELRKTEESLEGNRSDLLSKTERLEQLEGERNLFLERQKHSNENELAHAENLALVQSKIKTLEDSKQALLENLRVKETTFRVTSEEASELTNKMAQYGAVSEEAIENRKSDLFELKYEQTTIRNDLGYIDREFSQMESRLEKLEQENKKHVTSRADLSAAENETKAALDELKEALNEQLEIYSEVKATLAKQNARFEANERDLYRHYEKVQQMKSRKETLEELADDYAGFFQGVREVLKAKSELPGIIGALIELVLIPEKYQKALEIALSASAQNIVTENDEAARAGIAFLKKAHAGRATFLPLSTIQPRHLPDATRKMIQNQPAFVALASDVVRFDQKLEPVILNALGTTILAKDLKGAGQLAKLVNYRYRVVTLDGDVVNAGGSMTGGATKQGKSSILTRKSELETLTKTMAELSAETVEKEALVKSSKESLRKKQEELEETRLVGENLRLREQELLGKLTREQESLERLNQQLSVYDLETEESAEEKARLTAKKAELEQKNVAIEAQITEMDAEIADMIERSKVAESKLKSDEETLSNLKAKIAVQKSELEQAKTEVSRVQENLDENYLQQEELENKIADLKNNLSSVSMSETEAARQIERTRGEKEAVALQIETLNRSKAELQAEIADLEARTAERNNQASFYLEQKNKAEIQIGKAEVDVRNRTERLMEAYMLTPESAKEKRSAEFDMEALRSKVRLLKRSIDELGVVNIGAIDEFERIHERHTFLTGQQEDLLSAKETLFQVMDEMDEEVKKRFGESFEAIKREFAITFPELFGGGRAELVLLNPEDLLTTGIDIVAQPPGKKLQNLSLRSGGERALTAIALLFAIIRVRPVPFCILDEVEAALDEANVVRFSRYLKHFEENTQFIVITHRKGTMEEADVLYGVTMQESGVSKLVSVRLEETAELIK